MFSQGALLSGNHRRSRCSGIFQQWAAGMRERGKSKMAVIGAAMRKLIHLAYGVLKTGKTVRPELDGENSLTFNN